MKILSSFTLSHVVPNPYDFLLCNTKWNVFKNIFFHILRKSIWSNVVLDRSDFIVWRKTIEIFVIYIFVFYRIIQVWNYMYRIRIVQCSSPFNNVKLNVVYMLSFVLTSMQIWDATVKSEVSKGTVHPKIKIWSLTHRYLIPNLYHLYLCLILCTV